MKLNEYGDTIWTKTYGGSQYDEAYGIIETKDDAYVFVGTTDSEDEDVHTKPIHDGFNNLNWWINDLRKETNSRTDLQHHAKMLEILCHYELKNNELLISLIQSIKRILKNNSRNNKVEIVILNGITEIINLPNLESSSKTLNRMYDQINKIKHLEEENDTLRYFDYIAWIASKIHNLGFQETIKKHLDYPNQKNYR